MQEENGQLQEQQAQIVGAKWRGKVPKNHLELLQGRLAQITDEKKIASLGLIELKSPVVGLILGLLFGGLGVDRFYKGDTGLAIGKFLSCFIIVGFFWTIIDWFLVWKGIKKDNFEKINNQLLLSGV
ncbi:NINE protein [Helicobacter sp. MIT 21-1697]|uniref:NINE protein n=1 Tax=Helicobacter sp. MIT 21-1697 TaxID=2993733 RepID=UPI00224A9B4C|nr:NINE protein [Helicobacter sp. MIT 21-1697]MCX2717124.1 NINE protein [Helicobacter sp. MIT 21-1697]